MAEAGRRNVNISDLRARVRKDLHDEVSASYRWTDAELDRHLSHAVRQLSLSIPMETTAMLTTGGESGREVSLASLTDLVNVEAVEHPVGLFPPAYAAFTLWGGSLTLLADRAPSAGDQVRVLYGRLHTLDESGSTIPAPLEDLAATGASGYAALEWSSYAINRVNVGGVEVWRQYRVWGQERLDTFNRGLSVHSSRNRVRPSRLFTPARPGQGQTLDRSS